MNSTIIRTITGRCPGIKTIAATFVLGASATMLTGCNDAQAGGLLGGGIGALLGQAIGHDTGSTLLGLGIGAGPGYILGNESDKDRHDHYGHYAYHDDYYRYQERCHGNYDY